ncbi:MAG TPA: MFS transporter, partial [Geodermatophilus sp.]|nr:MFS transporter [Geodermatophilus sp.]
MTTAPGSATPAPERSAFAWRALAVLCAAQLMIVLDSSIVNVALPSIRTELGLSDAALQAVVTAYALTFGGLLLLGGRLGDLLGRRRLLLASLLAFAVASLAGGLAESGTVLIAA